MYVMEQANLAEQFPEEPSKKKSIPLHHKSESRAPLRRV